MSGLKPAKAARVAMHQLQRLRAAADLYARKAVSAARGGSPQEREAVHWSARGRGRILTWQDHPVIRRHINRRVSGYPDMNWIEFFAAEYGRTPFDRGLNLGCGEGRLEEHAFSIGLVSSFLSVDLSEEALKSAAKRLRGRPVEFLAADVNTLSLEPSSFDVAFCASSLHHFTSLECVLDQVKAALRPGGFLVFDEFVGPSRFQWTDRQLELINTLIAALPPRYRKDLRRGFGYKDRVYRPARDERWRDSPFEAARSQEIMALVEERFVIRQRRDYGGALLHQLLDGIAGNFKPDVERDVELLEKMAALEMLLEEQGVIGSDFTAVVAQKGGG